MLILLAMGGIEGERIIHLFIILAMLYYNGHPSLPSTSHPLLGSTSKVVGYVLSFLDFYYEYYSPISSYGVSINTTEGMAGGG